jgi:hypothetical protein
MLLSVKSTQPIGPVGSMFINYYTTTNLYTMVSLRYCDKTRSTAERFALLLILITAPAITFGQYFNNRIDFMGYNQPEVGFSIEKMTNGNYLIFHGTFSETGDNIGLGRTEISLMGETLNQTAHFIENRFLYTGYPGTSFRTMDGGFVSSGTKEWNPFSYESLLTVNRYDANGEIEWIIFKGDSLNQTVGQAAAEHTNGNLAAVGFVSIPPQGSGNSDAFLFITDGSGSEITFKTFGGNLVEEFVSIRPTFDGGYILGGYTRSFLNIGRNNHYVVKTDGLGNQQWMHVAGSQRDEFPAKVIQTADGNYVYGSCWNHYESNPSDFYSKLYLSKLNQNGSVIWENEYLEEPMYRADLSRIIELPNGDLAGIGYSENGMVSHLLKTDANGNEIWLRNIGHPTISSNGVQLGYDLIYEEEDMGFVGTGWVFSPTGDSIPGQDIWVFRTDSMGCLVPGCHLLDNVEVQKEEVIVSLYPNPVKDLLSVHIKSGPMPRGAQLELYDIHGRQHSTTRINPGATTYILQLGHLPAGMYLLRCVTDNEVVWSGKVVKN